MNKIRIGKRMVGEGHPVFIIAEVGVNHNGKIILAKRLIDSAKKAGADAVKFQAFKTEDLVTRGIKMADYQKKNIGKKSSQLKMLKKLELKYEDFIQIKKYCDKRSILFLCTPHSEDVIDFLEPLIPAYKIGSGDLTNLPFLRKIAEKKKPIILSTGMATLSEVEEAIKVIRNNGIAQIVLLHCTTNYPCSMEDVNLKAMETMRKRLNCPVGYSDHTQGIIASIMAATMEAVVIEKHFTLNKNLPGPDHKASLEPNELKEMITAIRNTEKALGDGVKEPTKSEKKIKRVVRKNIVARVDINKGSKISREMLTIKRAGFGIEPKYIDKIIGRKAIDAIKKDKPIIWNKIEI